MIHKAANTGNHFSTSTGKEERRMQDTKKNHLPIQTKIKSLPLTDLYQEVSKRMGLAQKSLQYIKERGANKVTKRVTNKEQKVSKLTKDNI